MKKINKKIKKLKILLCKCIKYIIKPYTILYNLNTYVYIYIYDIKKF